MEDNEETKTENKTEVKKPRLLNANEIECRVGTITAKGYTLLLYKDARVDMKLLDETYGEKNWQRTHEVINGNLFCNIEVWDNEKKCWVKKQDVGTESMTEKEKGEASDSFKRAGFNWSIGRELYTSPFIWITPTNEEVEEKDNKLKIKSGFTFRVSEIGYNGQREINKLIIKLKKYKEEKTIFMYGTTKEEEEKIIKSEMVITKPQEQQITELSKTKKVTLKSITEQFKKDKLSDLNYYQAELILKKLEEIK